MSIEKCRNADEREKEEAARGLKDKPDSEERQAEEEEKAYRERLEAERAECLRQQMEQVEMERKLREKQQAGNQEPDEYYKRQQKGRAEDFKREYTHRHGAEKPRWPYGGSR
ncbi:MAG: hypothetical protein ABFD98_04835 [Syntrophobacteraceae bacterium]